MITRAAAVLLAVFVGHPSGTIVIAQGPARPTAVPTPTVTALMVEVTISRHLGDKRISSTPFTLSVVPADRSSLRMGGDVPIQTTTFTPLKDDAKPANPLSSFSYRPVGTDIDVIASVPAEGQYKFTITIEESSIYPPEASPATTKTTGMPAFRRFRSVNAIALRDGQSLEYVMATDRISGEVYRVSVKLTVVK